MPGSISKNEIPSLEELSQRLASEERIRFDYKGKRLALLSADDLEALEALEDRYYNETCDRLLQEIENKGEIPIPLEEILIKYRYF